MTEAIDQFQTGYGFPLDAFQRTAAESLMAGNSVLVAAPTGAGKTVVGEFACWHAIETGTKCFYTTPIKALSNQKFRDLVERHGADNVGLLTGDRAVNGDAPIVVMTTEIVRNMLYEQSPTLNGLRYVVLDEVHYLADRSRGAVWEEVIIQLPQSVQLAALSATVSNAEEFGEWLSEVRGGCDVVIEDHRPVPLRHHYFVNDRLYPTFTNKPGKKASQHQQERAAQALAGVPNPDVLMLERRSGQKNRVTGKGRRVGGGPRLRWPSRERVVEELFQRRWLPAIMFVFSRKGCEDAVADLLRAGVRLTTRAEREELGLLADTLTADIPQSDLRVLGFDAWRSALLRGVAAHHAGLVPAFKEAVEVAFQRGLLKVVVATETLAMGINMPARTVVIERIEKWDGERHVKLTPGQYTQLTGRAGRRGIDDIGHAVVLHQRNIDFRTTAGLVGTRTYPLSSSFAPSYNMAVNLLRGRSRHDAEVMLGASFAQFQTDRSLSSDGVRMAELDAGLKGYGRNLECEAGDWDAYWSARTELGDLEKQTARKRARASADGIAETISSLIPGQVVYVDGAPRRGLAAVVGLHVTSKGVVLAEVVTEERRFERLGPRDVAVPPLLVGSIELPRGNARQHDYRDIVGARLGDLDPPTPGAMTRQREELSSPPPPRIAELRTTIREHGCHTCEDLGEHETWQYRYDKLAKESRKLRSNIEHRSGSLVRQFDRIVDVLTDLGYLDDDRPTEDGMMLARIYSEADLLVAECLRQNLLEGSDAADIAAFAAHIAYEPRGGEPTEDPQIPTLELWELIAKVDALASAQRQRELAAGLDPLRDLDPGFVACAYRWTRGADLDDALGSLELTGGDFVRNVRQVADLTGQLRDVGGPDLRSPAREALDGLRRGIVEA